MSAPNKRTGSCLCKTVKLEMTGSPLFANQCHCLPCQKKCGTAFSSNVFYREDVSQGPCPGKGIRGEQRGRQKEKRETKTKLTPAGNQQVKFTLTEPSVLKTYEDTTPESGSVLSRFFCGNCGSGVKMTTTSRPGVVAVGIGIIDGDRTDLQPTKEFFCDRKLPWVAPVAGAKGFPMMPPPSG